MWGGDGRVVRERDVDVSPTVHRSSQHLEQCAVFHRVSNPGQAAVI